MRLRSHAFVHSALANLSENERVALFHLGHLHNELLWSQKHLLWVWHNRREESEPETNTRVFAFVSSIARFAGQLVEANNAIESHYYGTQLSRRYHGLLSVETQQALASLRRYFGNTNLITKIRNNFAFHFDVSQFRTHVAALPSTHPHRFLIGEHGGNTFFEFAHNVHAQALLSLADATNVENALERLSREVAGNIPDWIFAFITEFILAIFRQTNGVAAEITLQNVPNDSEIHLPFFTQPPEPTSVAN